MFAPVLDLLHAHGARDKVCHPELVSGSKLSANHTSPYPLLLRRGYSSLFKSRLVERIESFLNIFKKAISQFIEIILMQTLCLP